MAMIQIRTFFLVLTLMQIIGCSNNLDVECAEFYEEVNSALDVIISMESEVEKTKLIENLNSFAEEFDVLEKKVDKRYDEKKHLENSIQNLFLIIFLREKQWH
jgi:hypothetical protein